MKDIGFIMLNSSKNILLIALFTAAFVWSCSDSNPVNEFGDEDYGEVTFTISGDVEGSFPDHKLLAILVLQLPVGSRKLNNKV